MERIPVVYSAHHASDNFSYEDFGGRCALTSEQRKRFSDYGTDETVPQHGLVPPFISCWSRGIVDLNNPDDWSKCFKVGDFAKDTDCFTPRPHAIWIPGRAPTSEEKVRIMQEIYYPYYAAILANLRKLEPYRNLLVVGWDNTADYGIGTNEAGARVFMPAFVVSNRGTEGNGQPDTSGSLKGEVTTCDPQILELFAHNLRCALREQGMPDEVCMNLVYRGGNIPRTFTHRRTPSLDVQAHVQSLQLEYNTKITHDQVTLEPYPGEIAKLRIAVERAMRETYVNLLTHPVFCAL